MGGYGHRNMYNLTGLPGWMRLGYSPGWLGRSASGMGPCAEYLASGRWPTPQMEQAWQAGGQGGTLPGRDQELSFLKRQAEVLSQQMERVRRRVEELEGSQE